MSLESLFNFHLPDLPIPILPKVSDVSRRPSKDATEQESIKELTSKLEEVASQHAESVTKSRPQSGKRSSDDSLDILKADVDPKGKM